MIEITRLMARQVRAVFTRALPTLRSVPHVLVLESGHHGLTIRAHHADVAIQFHQPGTLRTDCLALPLDAFKEIEGSKPDPVTLESSGDDQVTVRWTDKTIPRTSRHDTELPLEEFPHLPERMVRNDARLFSALRDASQTVDAGSLRYALGCIQLRGQSGTLVATDSRQALIQSGFEFPWDDDVLIPANRIFSSREFAADEGPEIGKTDDWGVLRSGPWTVFLKIEKEARFPQVNSIVPQPGSHTTTLHLAETDATFLADALKRLPTDDDGHRLLTVDLNGSVAVRKRARAEERTTELLLSGSHRMGEQVAFSTDGQYLARAMELGFRELHVTSASAPILCRDEQRQYVWMVLDPSALIQAGENPIVIASSAGPPARNHTSAPPPRRRRTQMARTSSAQNGSPKPPKADRSSSESRTMTSLIEDAEALRGSLRDTLGKTNALIAGLKRQRKQTRLMRTTLQSLRELQSVEA